MLTGPRPQVSIDLFVVLTTPFPKFSPGAGLPFLTLSAGRASSFESHLKGSEGAALLRAGDTDPCTSK